MSALANSLQKPERFDLYVRKFRAICVMHGVQVGSSGDLCGFMEKLTADRHLAMDFWAFVGKLSSREGGELPDDQMLAVIVGGITGGDSSPEDDGLKRAVDDLRAMLAGVDIHGPEQSQVALAPFPPRSDPGPQQVEGELRPRIVELPLKSRFSRAAFSPEAVEAEANHTPASLPPLPPQLDEALVRLGVANLVKQYLDDVDKRIRRLEAPPEGETPPVTIASPTIPRSLEEPPDKPPKGEMEDPPIMFHDRSIGNERLVLRPDVSHVAPAPALKDLDLPIRVPLENYSPPKGFGRTIFEVGLVLALFEAVFAGYQHRTPVREEIGALVLGIRNHVAEELHDLWKHASTPIQEERPIVTLPVVPHVEQPEAPPPLEGISTPPSATVIADEPATRPPKTPVTDRISRAEEAGAIRVSSAAMDARLVMSRVPAYPEVAKLDRIEGHVVMQAIISKYGTVKHVHVIEGDSRLRGAATDAVYKWRYRPYLLDGRPVDVATNITVDFKLNR